MLLLASSGPPRVGGLIRTAVLLGAGAAFALVARDRLVAVGGDGTAGATPCPDGDVPCEVARDGATPARTEPPPAVDASEVCLRAGYLCAALSDVGEVRVTRWNSDTGRLRIRVPPPPGESPRRARELQDAVARGIRAWHGRPFPVRVDLSDRPGDHHFVVSWSATLEGRELGRTRTRWVSEAGRADLEVREFALATRDPFRPDRGLPPEQVELTAAHEMGHALGLPHSDEPRDVMYPENTATRLTARDFITMSALYELDNGAVIR